jgi:hypothetical protein
VGEGFAQPTGIAAALILAAIDRNDIGQLIQALLLVSGAMDMDGMRNHLEYL